MLGKKIGCYSISSFIGKGAFGSVYKCIRDTTSKTYAIKIFNREYVYEEFTRGANNRISREIETLTRIDHPNVIKYIESGELIENSQIYIYVVMEFLEGSDIRDIIRNNRQINEKDIFFQILEGLNAIHSKGIIHRDLKPENIYLTNAGEIKLLDFGLSKLIDYSSLTSTGSQIGSPLYMSPEQINDSKNIDYRSDYYSLGVLYFEILTKVSPYGRATSLPELFYRILNNRPDSILLYRPDLDASYEKLIYHLLEKTVHNRPNSISDIKKYFNITNNQLPKHNRNYFEPGLYLRTWNEKQVLTEYLNDGYKIKNAIFPINHQYQQKNLLKILQNPKINLMFDPATMRLAYDTFSDVKGLTQLPYAPSNYSKIELSDLDDDTKRYQYIKSVIDTQLEHDPTYLVSPFHVSNNSEHITIKHDRQLNWFNVDYRLIKQTRMYLDENNISIPLIAGFSIRSEILTSKVEKEYFINILTGLPCDGYLIYVDCINHQSSTSELYHFIQTLRTLQVSSGKPVIAGRVGLIGLLLLAFGIHGFESGSARFESFYEDLYKDRTDSYNLFVRYYIPELFANVPINRKDPSKLFAILAGATGKNLACNCPYCKGKPPEDIIIDKNTKKHFLYRIQNEIDILLQKTTTERLDKLNNDIVESLNYYKALKAIFKPESYQFLNNWQLVIEKLRKLYGI